MLATQTHRLLRPAFSACRQNGRGVHLAARKLIVCEGERQQQGEAQPAATSAPPPAAPANAPSVRVPPQQRRMPPPPPSPYGPNVKVGKLGLQFCSRAAPPAIVALWRLVCRPPGACLLRCPRRTPVLLQPSQPSNLLLPWSGVLNLI